MKMQTFRKPHQWLSFWLEKYVEVLAGLKYDGEQRKKYWAVLKTFLEELPGNPRNLPLAAVQSFIAARPDERLLPITIFYQHIAPSKQHLEMLKKIDETVPAHEGHTHTLPLDKFKKQLLQQQLTERTVKNYCSALSGYLTWMEEQGTGVTVARIDEYCQFLATVKQLAPRTVAMHHTALKLYYAGSTAGPSGSPS